MNILIAILAIVSATGSTVPNAKCTAKQENGICSVTCKDANNADFCFNTGSSLCGANLSNVECSRTQPFPKQLPDYWECKCELVTGSLRTPVCSQECKSTTKPASN